MGQKFPIRKDILTHVHRAIEQQRKDNISKVAESSTGGGSGAWCQIDHRSGWADGTAGSFAQMADMSIFDQSGGFSLADPQTLIVPEGLYTVEWAFDFWFPFLNPYSGYFGKGWSLWRGGPVAVTDSVRNFTSYDERILGPVQFNNDGGGDASWASEGDNPFVWRGIIRSGGGYGSLLSLGIIDFYDHFRAALDWTTDFTALPQPASNGSGHQDVWIASVG